MMPSDEMFKYSLEKNNGAQFIQLLDNITQDKIPNKYIFDY